MYSDTTLSESTLIKKQPGRRKAQIQNPHLIFEKAKQDIDVLFERLYEHHQACYSDFDHYVRMHEPKIMCELENLYEHLDTDIYGAFRQGRLSFKQYGLWRRTLHRWVDLMRSAVRFYEMACFGKNLVTHQPAN